MAYWQGEIESLENASAGGPLPEEALAPKLAAAKEGLNQHLDRKPQPTGGVGRTPVYSDADPSRAGQSYYGGGMTELVGDSREVMRAAAPTLDYKSYVKDADHLFNAFEQARIGGDTRSIEEWGKDHYDYFGKAEGREIGKIYGQDLESAGRRAGFDESGEFLGLSAFGEDIQAGNLSRQRERDLQDVARLSPLYSDIMEQYKPGTQEALESAQAVLKAREGDLTAGGAIDAPAPTTPADAALQDRLSTGSAIVAPGGGLPGGYSFTQPPGGIYPTVMPEEGQVWAYGPDGQRVAFPESTLLAAPTGYDAATVAAPGALTAATGYDAASAAAIDPLSAATGYDAKANLSSGRVGGDYEATRTISSETQTPLDFKNQGYMANALREYQASGGGSTMVGDVRVNNEEEFYNEFAKAMKVDVPYETFKQGYTTDTIESQSRGTGDIRAALMEDAYTGLGEGLTAREQEQIEQASRRRATALGRTFDRGSIADEVQSRVLEDRNRQAQNRAYAQQVLGQEAGLQTSDMGRNLQAQMQNQAAANQAAQYGVGAGLQQEQVGAQFAQQKALSDQAAANQAAQFGVGAGLQQEQLGAQMGQQKAVADAQAANQAAQYGVGAGLQQQQFGAGQDIAAQAMNREAAMKGSEFDILQDVARRDTDIARGQQAKQFDVGMLVDQQRLNEQLAQQGTLGYIDAATRLAALEDTSTLDPFQAVLGRTGGGSLQAGQGVFGQAQYGLESSPQYLRPETGLGFIQNQATNQANMYNTQIGADATRRAGMMGALGNVAGELISNMGRTEAARFCWVAREVYGPHNPAWLDFRHWMFSSAPRWFFKLYLTFGERFANFISNKPRLKARIRLWMDTKIGR